MCWFRGDSLQGCISGPTQAPQSGPTHRTTFGLVWFLMINVQPTILEAPGVRLEPLTEEHHKALATASTDGRLWELWYIAVPPTEQMYGYVADALKGQQEGHMLSWIVRDVSTGTIIGTTRYHDIVPNIDRVEIGYTWYMQSRWRTHVNTTCKLLLLTHAFETLGCKVVGLRTDIFNFRSQRAIEALGAKRDGVIRHFGIRRDGSARDVVMFSIINSEWPDVRRHLELRLRRNGATPSKP